MKKTHIFYSDRNLYGNNSRNYSRCAVPPTPMVPVGGSASHCVCGERGTARAEAKGVYWRQGTKWDHVVQCALPIFPTLLKIEGSPSVLFRPTAHYSLPTANSLTYTFSAKEKDSETGLSYFGSRYYSSDLSVWLSVDPMASKYPSLSPYVYCANNPVRVVDPDGEDYVVVVDDQSKTITIKATYYVTKDTKEGMEMGFQYFASQEQNLSYAMENGESYSIKFDLSIAGEYDTWNEAYDAWSSSGNKYSNFCMSGSTLLADNDIPAIAQTNSGNKITIRSDCSLLYRAYAHEIGHTLGFGEWSSELMRSDGFPQDIGLTNGYVQQSMIRMNHNATPDNISSPYGVTKTTRWDDVGKGYILTK